MMGEFRLNLWSVTQINDCVVFNDDRAIFKNGGADGEDPSGRKNHKAELGGITNCEPARERARAPRPIREDRMSRKRRGPGGPEDQTPPDSLPNPLSLLIQEVFLKSWLSSRVCTSG